VRLPGVRFPDDAQPDPDRPEAPAPVLGGPPTEPQQLIDAELLVPAALAAQRKSQDEQDRQARRRSRRRPWLVACSVVVIAAILVGAAFLVARAWLGSQWFVAVNGNAGTGTVGVYRGVQGTLVGVPLSSLWSDSGLLVGRLPYFDQELVSKSIPAANEVDAQRIVAELQSRAAQCQTLLPPAGCPGTTS